ncbi:MAG TPA: hypothetical protein VGE78_06310 [Agromyces sp.]
MKLESGPRRLELTLGGYQFPGLDRAAEGDWDANWLRVRGSVRDADLAWEFYDPCLTTWEGAEFLAWLRVLSTGGEPNATVLTFTEPNIEFAFIERSGDTVAINSVFSHESAPPGPRYRTHELRLLISASALGRAADDWEQELAAFPCR